MVPLRFYALLLLAGCTHDTPREAAPMPLPTVPVPEPPESVEGTYEIDPEKSRVSMQMTLVFEASGAVKRTLRTAFMKTAEQSKGHWRREGDAVVFTIDTVEKTCTRRADELHCGDFVVRRLPP